MKLFIVELLYNWFFYYYKNFVLIYMNILFIYEFVKLFCKKKERKKMMLFIIIKYEISCMLESIV